MNKQGVLLVNLGSPDSPAVSDVRRYLGEFLMDKRVLDAPWPIRCCVVYLAILPTRPRQSAEAYHKIWWPEGSPLVVLGRRVQAELQRRLPMPVELGMRYQNPSIPQAVQGLLAQGVERFLLVPLFPHFAMSSYETAVERVKAVLARVAPSSRLEVLSPFFEAPDYLDALVAVAADDLAKGYDHLLFSFHGLPERHLRKADPTGGHCLTRPDCCAVASPAHRTCYRAQCLKTVAGFVSRANVPAGRYSVAFQSRLGRDPWLGPATDTELVRLARSGIRRLLVMCPAFVADCLETLEEIGLRGREAFQAAGGDDLRLIPCLNAHPRWIAALEAMITRLAAGAGG